MKNLPLTLILVCLLYWTCSKTDADTSATTTNDAKLRLQFRFDAEQERLDNQGNPANMPLGHAAQTPDFNALSAFFIELVPTSLTQVRAGAIVYEAATQSAQSSSSFEEAVVFDKAIISDENVFFLEIPLQDIPVGDYQYLRASVTYQNFDIRFNLNNLPSPLPSNLNHQKGTLASFIGFNTFIKDILVKNQTLNINADRQQGFWAF